MEDMNNIVATYAFTILKGIIVDDEAYPDGFTITVSTNKDYFFKTVKMMKSRLKKTGWTIRTQSLAGHEGRANYAVHFEAP